MRKFAQKALVYGLFLALAGCMVGPDYERPRTAADTNESYYNTGSNIPDPNELEAIDNWWQHFADPVTQDLVRRALQNNYDLKAAAARVLQARALLEEVRGRQLPDISYNFARNRSKMSFNFGGTGRFSVLNTTYNQDFTAHYIVDLFGKLKRAERAAWAELLATEAVDQAVTNSIIATVIRTRVNIATIQRTLVIARANTASRKNTVNIVERRYKQGLVGPVDVRLARENLEAAKSAEPALERVLVTTHYALDVLLGRRPGSSPPLPETLADLPGLEPVPLGLPASLLDRRPDVIASEMSLRAANERVGISIAQLYPDLTLTGSLGRSSDTFSDLWIDQTEIYSAIIRLAQPIFKGGQLRAQIDGAKARFSELAADYARTVLIALEEVEDALVRERLLLEQLKYTQLRFKEALAAENLSQQRYQRGVESILAVLESERRRRIAENELALLKGQLWNTRVDLFLALGGDWTGWEQTEG